MANLNLQTGKSDDGRKAIILTIVLDDDETLTLAEDLVTEEPAPPTPARKTAVKKAVARKKTAQKGRTR